MSLQIRSTPGLIGINTMQGRLNVEFPKSKLEISQPKAEMRINSQLPRVIIDQYQCFAEAGLKNYSDLTKDNGQWAYKCFMERIARYNQEGDMLAQIEKGNSSIPLIAENTFPTYDFNINFIPKSRPKIDVTGHINIDWDIKKPIINYEVRNPVFQYEHGKVEISMRQWPSIEMNYVDENV
ncbi:MAG: hypothetical protein JM58_08735 [Peptococcaceae bacterium BICA1-8]|nr:MAG: hypothetical protein JM58_08735 [Peptococcaceae bacterium BICA1-8]